MDNEGCLVSIITIIILLVISIVLKTCEREVELNGGGGPRYVENVVIYSIQPITTLGEKNGKDIFHKNPTVYHIITSRGTFEINTEGPHKFDNAIPLIHEGDTLRCIKIVGAEPGPVSATYPSMIQIWFTDRAWQKYRSEAKKPIYIIKD